MKDEKDPKQCEPCKFRAVLPYQLSLCGCVGKRSKPYSEYPCCCKVNKADQCVYFEAKQ